jgi:hypothetical protein
MTLDEVSSRCYQLQIKEFSLQIRYHQRFTYTARHYFNMNIRLLFSVRRNIIILTSKIPSLLLIYFHFFQMMVTLAAFIVILIQFQQDDLLDQESSHFLFGGNFWYLQFKEEWNLLSIFLYWMVIGKENIWKIIEGNRNRFEECYRAQIWS